jgi:hypothetical protein
LGVGLRRPNGLELFPWPSVPAVAIKLSPDAAVPEYCPSVALGDLRFVLRGWSLLFLREGDSESDNELTLSDVWLIFPIVDAVEAPEITELMLSIELLGEIIGDAQSLEPPLAGILFPTDLDGIVLLQSDFDAERMGIL